MAESGCLKNVALNSVQADTLVLNNTHIKTLPKTSTNLSVAVPMPDNNPVVGVGGFFDLTGAAIGTVIKMYLVLSTVGATRTAAAKERLGVGTFTNNTITAATLGTALCDGGALSGNDVVEDNSIAAMATVIVTESAASATVAPLSLGVCNFFSSGELADTTTASHLTGAVGNRAGGTLANGTTHKFLGFSLLSESDANITNMTAKTVFEVITPGDI